MASPLTPRHLVLAAPFLAAGLVLSACGSGSSSVSATLPPKAQLRTAMSSVTSSPNLVATLHLDATPRQLQALSPQHGLSTAQSRLLSAAQLVFSVTSGTGTPLAQHPANQEVEVQLREHGGPALVDLRYLSKVLYLRIDAPGLATAAGANPASLAHFEAQASQAAQANPSLRFLQAGLQGHWLSLDVGALQRSGLLGSGLLGTTSTTTNPAALRSALSSVLARDVTVRRAGTDPTLGTDLVASGNLHQLFSDLVPAVYSSLPAQLRGQLGQLSAKIPNRVAQIHFFVQGDQLSAVRVNLAQLLVSQLPAGSRLDLELDLAHPSVSVTAPTGAVPVDLSGLLHGFLAPFSSSTTASSGGVSYGTG